MRLQIKFELFWVDEAQKAKLIRLREHPIGIHAGQI